MATRKSLNLDAFIHNRCYFKNETYTKTETDAAIAYAISNLILVEYVPTLPTTNIKTNRLYIVPNHVSPEISENLYDIYIYYNNKWEQIDSLEFDILNYYTKTQTDTLLAGKSNTNHTHNNATTSTNGFMSSGDKTKLDGIETNANKTVVDSSITVSGTNPVQGKAIYNALAGKSNTGHTHDDRYYTETEIDDKLSQFIDEEGQIDLQGYYKKAEIDTMMADKISSITIDDDLIMEIKY